MLYISICLTLLTLLAALYYMTRIKSEGLGIIHKLVTWIVLLTAAGILVCQLARGFNMMRCGGRECSSMEECASMSEGGHGGMMIHKEIRKVHGGGMDCCMGEGECSMMKGGECHMMKSDCCGGGKCKGTGECGGKCESGMTCCGQGSDCCGSGECKGTGECGGKCGKGASCCSSGKKASMEGCGHSKMKGDSVVMKKEVIKK